MEMERERERCRAPFNPNKELKMGDEAPDICKPQAYPQLTKVMEIGVRDP